MTGVLRSAACQASIWNYPQFSSLYTTPICGPFICGGGGQGSYPARTGARWVVFGGDTTPNTASIGQFIYFPYGRAELHFWMRAAFVSPPFTDTLKVMVNGRVVGTLVKPNPPELVYTERVINLDSFADDALHHLVFDYSATTDGRSNFLVDDISLLSVPGCPPATPDLRPRADFDGDGRTDKSVYRASEGNWYYDGSTVGFMGRHFGEAQDIPTPGDFDGDGKTDIAVFRPSTGLWYRVNSSNGSVYAGFFGQAEDIPQAADYDGDGKDDLAVFRPSDGAWYWRRTAMLSSLAISLANRAIFQ